MCIRDRFGGCARDLREVAPNARGAVGRVAVGDGGVDVVGARREVAGVIVPPVSYTHLRAHETVLDLVCRLLLEKKKQNTTYDVQQLTNKVSNNRTGTAQR